jgi:hypothetical protein
MTIPQHRSRSLWQPINIDVVGHHLADTFEAAALEAINIFCDQHPNEVVGYPIGLFPAADSRDPKFMNAQYRHQILQRRGMSQMTSIAQGYRKNINWQITQIEELQATITAKDEVIAQRDETITHREDQIIESDTLIIQRNTIIEFLQEQVHDLTLELGDAIAHIGMLHE